MTNTTNILNKENELQTRAGKAHGATGRKIRGVLSDRIYDAKMTDLETITAKIPERIRVQEELLEEQEKKRIADLEAEERDAHASLYEE